MTLLFALFLAACGPSSTPTDAVPKREGPLAVAALSFPAGWLAEQVGGERVVVTQIQPADVDAITWQPPAEVITGAQGADALVANGAGFEAWTKTATLPGRKLILSAKGLDLIVGEGKTHSHGKDGEHSHGAIDPHTWADPLLFTAQAEQVHAGFVRLDPQGKATYDSQLAAVRTTLGELDAAYRSTLAPLRGKPLASNHPAYAYIARQYGLDLTAFDFDPEEPVSAAARAAFDAWAANAAEAPVLIWESAPSGAVVASFPDGVRHVVVDPLETPATGAYDYVAQTKANLAVWAQLAP